MRLASPRVNHPLLFLILAAITLPATALHIRAHDPAVHNRFTAFPGAPVMNPTFLYDATKFTGLGWFALGAHKYCALVSPRHFVWATHHELNQGELIRYVDSNGVLFESVVIAKTAITSDASGDSDLTAATLGTPVPTTIKPFSYLNLPHESDYLLMNLMVFGFNSVGTGPQAGQGTIAGFTNVDLDGPESQGVTKLYRFDYNTQIGVANDCRLLPGDSGATSFSSVNGLPVLVGSHSLVEENGNIIENYDTFIPHYVAKLDVQMAPLGYRMRPAYYTPTTLSLSTVSEPGTLRRVNPGSVTFTFANSGGALTGNAELVIAFPAGQAPSAVNAPGWVVESTGPGSWSIRKATMAAAEDIDVVATWVTLPNVAALTVDASIQSDTATATNFQPTFALGPSYAAWSLGLPEPAQSDDPDDDGLINLLEYAFGGDALSGGMTLPSGDSLRPVLEHQAGNVALSYPERSDAVGRGLSYQIETATDLAGLAGATTLPAGAVSATEPFIPEVPGFVKRIISWPSDGPARFARVRVELSE